MSVLKVLQNITELEFILNSLTYDLLETFNVPTKWINQLELLPQQIAFTENELNALIDEYLSKLGSVGRTRIYEAAAIAFYHQHQTAQKILGKGIVPISTTSQLAEIYQAYIRGTQKYYPNHRTPIIRALNGESTTVDDVELHLNDRITPLEVSATPIFDNKGKIIYAIAAFQDITQRKQAEAEIALKNAALQQAKDQLANSNCNLEEKIQERTKKLSQTLEILEATQAELVKTNQELQRLSRIDKLTQIANRYYFDEYLLQAWNRLEPNQQPLSLIICDVDYFKKYNDFYGHQGDDRCLQQVSETLLSVVKLPAYLLARYGGEEFAVIMPSTNVQAAIVVAQEIQQAIHQFKLPSSSCLMLVLISANLLPSDWGLQL